MEVLVALVKMLNVHCLDIVILIQDFANVLSQIMVVVMDIKMLVLGMIVAIK